MVCFIEREGNLPVSHSGSSVVDYFALSDELIERLPVLSVAERSDSKHFHFRYDYNVNLLPLAKLKAKHEKNVWDTDRGHEFVERLVDLGSDEKLTELLQKENSDVDDTQGFISDSFLKAAEISKRKYKCFQDTNSLPNV